MQLSSKTFLTVQFEFSNQLPKERSGQGKVLVQELRQGGSIKDYHVNYRCVDVLL